MKRILSLGCLLAALICPPASAILDTNGNGMSDLWERAQNAGSLYTDLHADDDDDNDGWTNGQEAAAGTNPQSSLAPDGFLRPEVSILHDVPFDFDYDGIEESNADVVAAITWPIIAGKQYTLLHSSSLAEGSWAVVEIKLAEINGTRTSHALVTTATGTPPTNPKMFWRIKVEDIDTDGDELTDAEEIELGTNATLKDSDGDSLEDLDEIERGTDPNNTDTDGDGLPDQWEVTYHLGPLDPNGVNGAIGDPDNDGLGNFGEWLNGSDPHNDDSDDDGTGDGTKVNQGSDPNNAGDGGNAPPADQMVDVPFTVSDPSGSHSEKWKMMVRGLDPVDKRILNLASPSFGQPASATFKLRKGNRYEVSVSHLSTDPDYLADYHRPDFDWEATVDGKPTTTSVESIDGIPGVNNYFVVKDHWIADNRQAVFTTEKHGNDVDIVTGRTALLIPALLRDKDAIDNNWQPIAGDLGKCLQGQKINLRFNSSILGYGFNCGDPQWCIPETIFKDYIANQNSATLPPVDDSDKKSTSISFYFADSGSKSIILNLSINNDRIQLADTINVVEPTSSFTTKLGEVRFQSDVAYFNLGLHSNDNSPLGGLAMYGSVSVPTGEPNGVWHWVQLGTVERSKTNSTGAVFQFTMNGQKALDTNYGYSSDFSTDGNEKATSDSPAMVCAGWKAVSATDQFELYQMFRPSGSESRFVPLRVVSWGWNGTATKSTNESWTFTTASPPYSNDSEKTTVHPLWDKNLKDGVQPGP